MESKGSAGLIVDVGMNDGSDTAYYLAKGFDVVAIEANPVMVERVGESLASAVAEERLTIVPVAVADFEGEIDLFVSAEDLWSSTSPLIASIGLHSVVQKVRVPCRPLDKVLAEHPLPYYVKIDVEGSDGDCIRALGNLAEKPRYVSFEVDLTDHRETMELLDLLTSYGYRRFKMVNQTTHAALRLPDPPLEGRYVDARFNKQMSGPFGEESPGPWRTRDEVGAQYAQVTRRQAARIEYSTRGRIFGIPMRRVHGPMLWIYNTPLVAQLRIRYARLRRVEVGGWFDIHAAL